MDLAECLWHVSCSPRRDSGVSDVGVRDETLVKEAVAKGVRHAFQNHRGVRPSVVITSESVCFCQSRVHKLTRVLARCSRGDRPKKQPRYR
jgi:hypothetical protein